MPPSSFPTHLTLSETERQKLGLGTIDVATGTLQRSRGRLLKNHSGTASFPDSTEGTFSYERLGPAFHRFDYRYADGAGMPRQYLSEPLNNDPRSIERKAQEMVEKAYLDAIEHERKEYFCRASESPTRKKKRLGCQFTADRAKEIAGKYALCIKVGSRLIPISRYLDTMREARDAWLEQRHLTIACVNRLDKRLEELKYNLAHKDGHPRKESVKASNSQEARS